MNYLILNIHGLFRGKELELGRNSDTGGQTKYVLEFGKALGQKSISNNIYIFTRLIDDRRFSSDYALKEEKIGKNIKIIRIRCGGKRYIKKEKLWNYLDEFVDNCLRFIKENSLSFDIIHSHYADAGYIAMELSKYLNIPFIHTGHSLGISKREKLLNSGMSMSRIESEYNISRRIKTENEIIQKALFIITSTDQEIEGQYKAYKNFKKGTFFVIPPGVDLDKFYPYYHNPAEGDLSVDESLEYEKLLQARQSIKMELSRFLVDPGKPIILTICRPERRKNIEGLIHAYGNDKELQHIANLAIFAGIRKDIREKEDKAENRILIDMLLLMDKYDLYGKMAIPKKHDFEYEIPELYRYTASINGVFVNSAFIEPFGLTLIEASASGLPIVSTNSGGPKDIVKKCNNGILVDVSNTENISKGIKSILVDMDKWREYSNNGIINTKKHFSWETHSKVLLSLLKEKGIEDSHIKPKSKNFSFESIKLKFQNFKFFIITDIDNTLIGDDNTYLQRLSEFLAENKMSIGFGIATGRNVESALLLLQNYNVPMPDLFITSVGSEIYYYFNGLVYTKGWESYIKRKWNPERIESCLDGLSFLKKQIDLRKFKISYYIDEYHSEKIDEIHRILKKEKLEYNMIITEMKMIDIIPKRASKYKAIKYLCDKWNIYPDNILIAGDSGNDKEMLKRMPKSVIVSNYQKELENLKKGKNVYFSKYPCSGALLDALFHYGFIGEKLI